MGGEADDILIENWRGGFRHSAGRLGSHYLRTLRDESRLVGWRTGQPAKVLVPPKDLGDEGEWVNVGPGATLRSAILRDDGSQFALARVQLDGADSVMFARVDTSDAKGDLKIGDRLTVHFAPIDDAGRRAYWFKPMPGAV